jgi:ferric-dicitrate binding protein FerR (iron transport regulator)
LSTAPTPPDAELLDRYLAGECSDVERQQIEQWLREHPDEATRLAAVAHVARRPVAGLKGSEAAYAQFLDRVRTADVIPLAPRRRVARFAPERSSHGRSWLAAAAVVAMVGIGTWATMRTRQPASAHDSAAVTWKSYAAGHGQRTVIELADGTKVVLAPESELRVRQNAAATSMADTREVELSGEGFFEVAHVANRPFVIRTRHGAITQLGTAFDVRAYRGESQTQVVVTEGRVDLRPSGDAAHAAATPKSVVLAAGDFAVMARGGITNLQHGVDAPHYIAWTKGELRYQDAPLSRVIADLQRWYDVKIELGDSTFATYRLTATLRSGSVAEALDVVTKSLDLRAVRRGDTVRIVGRNAQPSQRP